MFDIGAMELLLVGIVALVIIGPKDLPVAMRTAGKWVGQLRAMTGHFRIGIDAMIREAEVEEQEKIWSKKNEEVMRDHPAEEQSEADEVMRPIDDQNDSQEEISEEVPATENPAEPSQSQLPLSPEERDDGSAETKS